MIAVYEAANTVEAHMIVHLLEQSDIEAKIDGEYLQGAMGELPAAGNVKVKVSQNNAREAKEIIAEWEANQPTESTYPRAETSSQKAPYFIAGATLATVVLYALFRWPGDSDGVDLNGNGLPDEVYHYQGQLISKIETDRNRDGQVDLVFNYGLDGVIRDFVADNDFNGTFEETTKYRNGNPISTEIDSNGDGIIDNVWRYKHGVMTTSEFIDIETGRIRKIQRFELGKLIEDEWDSNGDGNFDRKTTYDEFEEPIL
ncbi:MAG: DUF2007 domain-containing protein [Gammaproteobacteria bacterium]